jgi:hypothetical protein
MKITAEPQDKFVLKSFCTTVTNHATAVTGAHLLLKIYSVGNKEWMEINDGGTVMVVLEL